MPALMKTVLVCEAQVPFVRGGAELLVRGLVSQLRMRGYRAEKVSVPFKWYPKDELLTQAAAWRMIDLSESNGTRIDAVIATKFPTYFVRHPHKVTWLFHQYRAIYDLCGTPYSEFGHTEADVRLRDRLIALDNEVLGESAGLFANARNTASRLTRFNGLTADPLYHPPPLAGHLSAGDTGDYVLSVGRLEANKRVDLVIRALAHAGCHVRLTIVGDGPLRAQLERTAADLDVADRVTWTGPIDDRASREAVRGRAGRGIPALRRGLRLRDARSVPRPQAGGDDDRRGRSARVRRRRRDRPRLRGERGSHRRRHRASALGPLARRGRSATPATIARGPSRGTAWSRGCSVTCRNGGDGRGTSGNGRQRIRHVDRHPRVQRGRLGGNVVVQALAAIARWHEIVVVDDGSGDDTGARAEAAGARVVRHPYNKGNGAAVKTGIRQATGRFVLIADADGQHKPEDASRLVSHLDRYDLVVGARSSRTQASAARRMGNGALNRLASYLTEQPIPDLTSGFRAARRDCLLEFLHLIPNGFSTPTTTTLAFMKAGYSVRFEPVDAAQRAGTSNIKFGADGVQFVLILLKLITIFSPLRIFLPVSGAAFFLGAAYAAWTIATQSHVTNSSVLLILMSVVIFLVGLVSEQISALRFEGRRS